MTTSPIKRHFAEFTTKYSQQYHFYPISQSPCFFFIGCICYQRFSSASRSSSAKDYCFGHVYCIASLIHMLPGNWYGKYLLIQRIARQLEPRQRIYHQQVWFVLCGPNSWSSPRIRSTVHMLICISTIMKTFGMRSQMPRDLQSHIFGIHFVLQSHTSISWLRFLSLLIATSVDGSQSSRSSSYI